MTVIELQTECEKKEKEIKVQYLDTPVKSESDKKQYRVIKLENGLTALLISDIPQKKYKASPDTDDAYGSDEDKTDDDGFEGKSSEEDSGIEESEKEQGISKAKSAEKEEKMAACALSIDVGHLSDPHEVQGLAHFLEHMVFMGSEKYPDDNDFHAFVSKCGGYKNAITNHEATVFHFQIPKNHLQPAMDRFSQFFISPLMKKDAIKREREVVDSEFQMSLQSDYWQKYRLVHNLAGQNHPATKFLHGNLITLRDNIDEDKLYAELHRFRNRHYSAHRMTLAVQARLPLDTLEEYVKSCFSNVPVNHLPADDFDTFVCKNSFNNPDFRKLYKVKATKDVCQVELTWALPPLLCAYRSKPLRYVMKMLSQTGKGSLISYLRKKMWCLDIFLKYQEFSMFTLLTLQLELTNEGRKHSNEVLEAVLSYIAMLRREGPQRRLFNEIQQIENNCFRFKNEKNPTEFVKTLCKNMHLFPPKDYITGDNLYFEYHPESIQNCFDALIPDNMNILLYDKTFNEKKLCQVEPWYQTKYSSREIPKEWVERWKKIEPFPEFHLPKPNMFITDDFSLIELPAEVPNYPTKIYHDDKSEIWYRPDPKFRLPECFIYLTLILPANIESFTTSSVLTIFTSILNHLIKEELCNAGDAGLFYQIYSHYNYIFVKVNGYNQKLPLLLDTILKYIVNCHTLVSNDLFDVMKNKRNKINFNYYLKPADLARSVFLCAITSMSSKKTKLTALSEITFDKFINFSKQLTDRLYLRCLVQGNITQDVALESIVKSISHLNHETCSWTEICKNKWQVHEMSVGQKCCRVKNLNPADENSIVSNYYQVGLASIKQAAIIGLVKLIMNEPLFYQLRTQEQLGYSVYCNLENTYGVYGYSINVCTQANKFSTEHVDERIEEFIQSFKNILNEMSTDNFNFYKESLIKSKERIDLHLSNEVNRNWNQIYPGRCVFDRHHKEISAIEQLSLDEVRQWISDHSVGGKNFRKLTVQVVGVDNSKLESNEKKQQVYSKSSYWTFLTDENDKVKKPEGYFITNTEQYKSQLPVLLSKYKKKTVSKESSTKTDPSHSALQQSQPSNENSAITDPSPAALQKAHPSSEESATIDPKHSVPLKADSSSEDSANIDPNHGLPQKADPLNEESAKIDLNHDAPQKVHPSSEKIAKIDSKS